MADINQRAFIGQEVLVHTGLFQFGLDGQVPSPRQHFVEYQFSDFVFPEK